MPGLAKVGPQREREREREKQMPKDKSPVYHIMYPKYKILSTSQVTETFVFYFSEML